MIGDPDKYDWMAAVICLILTYSISGTVFGWLPEAHGFFAKVAAIAVRAALFFGLLIFLRRRIMVPMGAMLRRMFGKNRG